MPALSARQGVMECWSIGVSKQYSTTPILHKRKFQHKTKQNNKHKQR